MPYISQEARSTFESFTKSMENLDIRTPGELNYLLTMLIHRYLNQLPENYQSYNDVVGALECCKFELSRRHLADYENNKMGENGDV
jgi:hypothetical protein